VTGQQALERRRLIEFELVMTLLKMVNALTAGSWGWRAEEHASMRGRKSRGGATMARKAGERGSQVVEASFVFLPILMLTFLMIDLSMVIFERTTMQEAARVGARYAITAQNTTGPCQDDSIKAVVAAHAVGLLGTTAEAATIHVQFVNPITGGQGSNAPGQIVNVKIENYIYNPMVPFRGLNFSRYVSATASDVMEPYSGAAPCLTNPTDQ
jgi:Flp pilus assembly protein TadG